VRLRARAASCVAAPRDASSVFSRTIAPCGQPARTRLAPSHRFARPREQPSEQAELRRRERHLDAAAADGVRDRIEPEADRFHCRFGAPAAHERLQPRDELDERERLGEVVVASCVESGDAVDEQIVCGEEEHRRLDAPSAQRLAEVASVGVGQPDVDH